MPLWLDLETRCGKASISDCFLLYLYLNYFFLLLMHINFHLSSQSIYAFHMLTSSKNHSYDQHQYHTCFGHPLQMEENWTYLFQRKDSLVVILWLKLTHVNEVFRMFTTVLADWIDWMLACLVYNYAFFFDICPKSSVQYLSIWLEVHCSEGDEWYYLTILRILASRWWWALHTGRYIYRLIQSFHLVKYPKTALTVFDHLD